MFARAVLIGFLIGFAVILFLADGRAAEPMAVASAIPGSAADDRPGTLQHLPHERTSRLPRPVKA
jgi:hypothetical protein